MRCFIIIRNRSIKPCLLALMIAAVMLPVKAQSVVSGNKEPGKVVTLRQLDEIEPTFRPQVFYFLNARLDPQRIREQIGDMKKAGHGGFVVVPINGLPNAVMDDPWLDAMAAAAKRADELGMEMWIMEDWVFPSGFGGGLVTADPQFRGRRLRLATDVILEPGEALSLTAPPRTVSAGAVPIDKYTGPRGSWKPVPATPGQPVQYAAGNQRERFWLVTWDYSSAHQYTLDGKDHHSVDLLNTAATRRFLTVIHERYATRLAPYFGKSFKGFFNDESTAPFPFPWTEDFTAQFQLRKGYDVTPQLPMLLGCLSSQFTEPVPGAIGQVRKLADDYLDVWTDLIAENYYGEIERWCHAHGLLSLNNPDMEHRLYNLATVSGHFFKNAAYTDRPSVDVIYQQILPGTFTDFPRYAGSAARVLGKPRAMSESFAAMGFGMSADDMRYVLENQIVRGVTHLFLMHWSYADESEQDIRLWPPTIGPVNPVTAEFAPVLNERIGRLNKLMNTGHSGVQVGLYLPMHAISALQTTMAHPHTGNNVELPWESVERLARHLAYVPCEFDYLWDEVLPELELTNNGLESKLGNCYQVVILPPRTSPEEWPMKPGVVERLREFKRRGGKVIALESAAKEVADFAIVCALLEDLEAYLPHPVRIEADRPRISLAERVDGNCRTFLLLNEDTHPCEATLGFDGEGNLLELNPDNGQLTLLAGGHDPRISLRFDATALRAFILDSSGELAAGSALTPGGQPVIVTGWELMLPDGRRHEGGEALPDWTQIGFADYTGWMSYRASFEWSAPQTTGLLDLGEVCAAAEVSLDGKPVGSSPFRPHQLLLNNLTLGRHQLEVRVLNTLANRMSGKPESTPDYYLRMVDRRKLRSGLFGPVSITGTGVGPKHILDK